MFTPDALGRSGTLPRIWSPTRSASTKPAALTTSSILRDGSRLPAASFFIDSIQGANAILEHLAVAIDAIAIIIDVDRSSTLEIAAPFPVNVKCRFASYSSTPFQPASPISIFFLRAGFAASIRDFISSLKSSGPFPVKLSARFGRWAR